jgi:hypothetical protein
MFHVKHTVDGNGRSARAGASTLPVVKAGLVPAIHALLTREDVDARDKHGR